MSVATAILAGPILGVLSGRFPNHRSWLVLGSVLGSLTMWSVVLALPGPAPLWLLVLLIVVISVGGPGSMIGFDYARAFNPSTALGTANGIVNIGGFLATLLVVQVMGIVLEQLGGYTFEAFRVAWLAQYPIWVIALTGILISRGKARRLAGGVAAHIASGADGSIRRPAPKAGRLEREHARGGPEVTATVDGTDHSDPVALQEPAIDPMEHPPFDHELPSGELRRDLQRFLMVYKFGIDEMMTKINILRDEFSYVHDYNPPSST